ncbi:hypothetical protein HDU92_002858, partial [Lobulomyces angularis]
MPGETFRPLETKITNMIRLIEIRAKELDTELSNLAAGYENLKSLVEELAPEKTIPIYLEKNPIWNCYCLNKLLPTKRQVSIWPVAANRIRFTLLSVQSLYDVLRTLTPDAFDEKLKGNFSNEKIAMTSYESFLTTLFAPKKQKKLVLSNTIRTDGIRLQLLFFNIEKSALSSNPDYRRFQVQEMTRLKEVGKWTPPESFKPRIVVGVDLGDRWPVAACAVNYETKVKKHLKIRKGNLYSGLKELRKETEYRKINTGINLVEAEVSDVKSRLQHMEQLMNFYSSKTNLSHVWKSKKVQQSTYDKLFRDMLAVANMHTYC